MSDPGQICIVHSNNPTPIYFYTFFYGFYVDVLLAKALELAHRKGQLRDESHATGLVFDSLSGYTWGRFSFGINIAEPHVYNGNPIPTVVWESANSEPHIVYVGRRYSAREFIKEFLPTDETYAEEVESE
jgi:hypothetical protein